MKRRAFSLLLSLTLLFSLALPATTAYAEDGSSNKGMEISKTATANQDGSYTITLEAYATGEKVISEITKDVPTDIILVLDQSGSMANDIGTVSFEQYKDGNTTYHTRNQDYYEYRHNGGSANLWHKLPDGSYVSVSVAKQEKIGYNEITNGRNNQDGWYNQYTNLWNNRDNLYALVSEEYVEEYVKVSVNQVGIYPYTYTYMLPNGTVIASGGSWNDTPNISGTDDDKLYLASVDDAQTVYTYTYTDLTGTVQDIVTSTGAATRFTPAFYQRTTTTSGGGSRLDALKTAVANFAAAVNEKAKGKDQAYGTPDDINHRIAVVGFASGSIGNTSYPEYLNSEVFIGDKQYNYNVNASSYYDTAFQDINTQAGYDNIIASKNALDAAGATQVDLGIEMANGIFDANPIAQNEQRNRVMIVFTDGMPSSWSDYDSTVADNAIDYAQITKADAPNGYGATVYSVGIFSGADATSAGDSNGNDTQKANWFMQKVSSNNGTPSTASYYLSASDADTLNSIFQQISDQIETGGSSTTLGEETVIKDIVAPAFTLPEGVTEDDIIIETYACTGKDTNDNYKWEKNPDVMGATAIIGSTNTNDEITRDNQVSVTGFDFAENYVGTVTKNGVVTYHGHKLVIKLTVTPRPGFLGGNGVSTNTNAGVYEDADATNPVLTFEQPTVDVPIPEITINTPSGEKNIYLLQTIPSADIHEGVFVQIGNQSLDLAPDAVNWGLEPWQNEYLDISVTYKDEEGNPIPQAGLQNITGDTTYSVTVAVEPKAEGTVPGDGVTQTGSVTVNVFTPELTFKDSTAYYGESVPANNNYSGNKVGSETWKHGDTASTDEGVTMLGAKPTLDISYTPDESKLKDGKYTKQDVPVSATVKIGAENVNEHTTFVHDTCTEANCNWTTPTAKGAPAFLIHIQTCTLNITKQGGADNESYVFDVLKDGEKYSEVTVWGNSTETLVELPIGTYTISENAGWSWRYSANNGGSAALTAQNPTGSITCVNTKNNNQWLNGFSEIVRNIFGTNH